MGKLFLSGLMLFLVGCATPYQPSGATGGYHSTQYGPNVFNVTFDGNGFTNRTKASDFALLRSAEITIENGFRFFTILSSNNFESHSTYTTPTTTNSYATANVYGNTAYGSATSTTYGGQTYNIRKPTTSNTIVCHLTKPEGQFAYDAEFLYKSLTSKYGIKQKLRDDDPIQKMPPPSFKELLAP